MPLIFGPEEEIPKRPSNDSQISVFRRSALPARELLVLVHGLGGDAFATWGNWVSLARAHSGSFDVGTVSYVSGIKRLTHRASKIQDVVAKVADELRGLNYTSIVLVGHSMGGQIVKAAIARLHSQFSDGADTIRRIAGLVMMASPGQGSGYALLSFSDLAYLRPSSKPVDELNQFFANQVDIDARPHDSNARRAYSIPLYAAIATLDRFVNKDSSRHRTLSSQQAHFQRRHSDLTKAHDPTDQVYEWTMKVVSDLFRGRHKREMEAIPRRPTGSISYNCKDYTRSAEVAATLRKRIRALELEHRVVFLQLDEPEILQSDLILRIVSGELLVNPEVVDEIKRGGTLRSADRTLALVGFGAASQNWQELYLDLFAAETTYTYIESAPSLDELSRKFADILWLTIDQRRAKEDLLQAKKQSPLPGSRNSEIFMDYEFGGFDS